MFKQIHSRSFSAEVNAVTKSILEDLAKKDFSFDPFITGQIEKLITNNELMTEVLNEKAAQSVLGPLDEERDDALRGVFYEVKGKELRKDKEIKDAAIRVNQELDKYGFEIIELSFEVESSNINALLQDLKKPDVAEAIGKLPGLDESIAQLEAAQKEFQTAFLDFLDVNIEREKLLSAHAIGKLLRNQINNELMLYLAAMAMAKPEQFKDSFRKAEEIIDNNNKKVRTRLRKLEQEAAEV